MGLGRVSEPLRSPTMGDATPRHQMDGGDSAVVQWVVEIWLGTHPLWQLVPTRSLL